MRKIKFLIIITIICIVSINSLYAVIQNGEKLTFDVRYGLISAAEAVMTINSGTYQEKQVWYITSKAKTYPFFDSMFKVRDMIESIWEKDKLRSLRFTKRLNEGKYRQYRVHTFDHEKKISVYSSWKFKEKKFKIKELPVPENTQDVLSAFYWTRQQNLQPGKTVYVDITTDGKTQKTAIIVHKKETIDSIFGKKECLIIEPQLAGEAVFKQTGKILIWVTNDKYKIPLKMTSQVVFGAFVAILKSAENVPYPIINN